MTVPGTPTPDDRQPEPLVPPASGSPASPDQPAYGQGQSWQPQNGARPEQPSYGAGPSGPQYGEPQYGAGSQPPRWSQPSTMLGAKPGIIPLRPLSLGEILDGAFNAIRKYSKVTLGLSLVITTICVTFATAVGVMITPWLSSKMGSFAEEFDDADLAIGSMSYLDQQGILGIGTVGVIVATIVATGTLIYAIGQLTLGRRVTAGEVWRQVRPRIFALLGLTLLTALITSVIVGIAIGLVVLASQLGSGVAIAVGFVLGLVALVLAFAVGVMLSFAPAVLVLEQSTIVKSVARSWRLVRSSFWRVLGIQLLTSLIVSFVQQVIMVPLMLIGTVVGMQTDSSSLWILIATLANVLGSTIGVSYSACVLALVYIDVRMRREGLDVELAASAGRP